jgi:class 3 adenylate cyclase
LVHHLMSRFYEAMRAVLEDHGGEVAKFIGAAVMAVFGAREVREDDAERAIRAPPQWGGASADAPPPMLTHRDTP